MMMVHTQAHGFLVVKEEEDSKTKSCQATTTWRRERWPASLRRNKIKSSVVVGSSVNFFPKNKTNLSDMSDAPLMICSKSLVFHQRTKKQTHATSRRKKVRKRDGLMCKLLSKKQDQPECYEWCTIDFLFEEFVLPPKTQKTNPCDQQKKKVKMRDVVVVDSYYYYY